MKRFLIIITAALSLLAFSCQKAELVDSSVVENSKTYIHYLTAGVEDNMETRVGFDENRAFYWHEDDAIAVQTIVEGEEGEEEIFTSMYKLDDAESTEPSEPSESEDSEEPVLYTMRFGTTLELEGRIGNYALYPADVYGSANLSHRILGSEATYVLPSEYHNVTFDENGHQDHIPAAMWAKIEDGNATFKHLGGFFKIIIEDLPARGTLTVTTPGRKLTGDFVCDLSVDTPTINTTSYIAPEVPETPAESDEEQIPSIPTNNPDGDTVTIGFTGNEDQHVGIFYIPAPLGSYEYVDITVDDESDPSIESGVTRTSKTFSDVTVRRCTPAAGIIMAETAEYQLQYQLDNFSNVALNANIYLTSPLIITKKVTLDLGGKIITGGIFTKTDETSNGYKAGEDDSFVFWIKEGGELTIIDSSEDNTDYFETATGSVRAQGAPNSHVAYIENGGVLNIEAGNFYNDNDPADGDGSYLIKNEGTLNISGGKFVPCYDYDNGNNDTFSESNYLAYDKLTSTDITGGEFFGFKPNNSIGITENIVYDLDRAFGEDYDVEYEFEESPYVTTYMVTSNKAETFEKALNYFNRVPLTEALEVSPTIEEDVTLNLRNNTLTGTINNTAELMIVDGSINTETGNSIVNSGTVTLENVKINHKSPASESGTTAAIVNKTGTNQKGITIDDKDDEYFVNNEITKPVGYGTVITSDYYLCIKSIGEAPAAIATRGVTIPETLPKGEVPTYATVVINSGKYFAPNSSAVKVTATDLKIENAAFESLNHSIIVTNSIVTYTDTEFSQTGGTDQMDIYTNPNDKSIINASVANGNDPYVISEDNLQLLLDNGGDITLPNDITLTKSLELKSGKNVTIDLGGYTLATIDSKVDVFTLTAGTLTLKNGTIKSAKDGIRIDGDKTKRIIIEESLNIVADRMCLFAAQTNTGAVTIETSGNLTANSVYGAIQTGGTAKNVTLKVYGGEINGGDAGIYFPSTTKVEINGGEINGATAMYHKSGELNITDGKFTATGAKKDYAYNSNGFDSTGDALVIEACDYPGGVPVVSISGGEFFSTYAKAIGYYRNGDKKLANEKFISGGKFSDASAFEYLANNANVELTKDATLDKGFTVASSGVVINLNGYAVNGSDNTVIVDGSLTINGKGKTANSTISRLNFTVNPTGNLDLQNVNYDNKTGKITAGTATDEEGNTITGSISATASTQENLTNAIQSGATTVNLTEGEFNMPQTVQNKTVTISGTEDVVVNVNVDGTDSQNTSGSTITFEGVTIQGAKSNYRGFPHTKGVTFKKCTIKDLIFLFSTTTFEECTFVSEVEHCVWTYGAGDVTFKNCNFTYSDRCINVYSENNNDYDNVTFTNCKFTTKNVNSKGAVEINSSLYVTGVTVSLNECVAPAYGDMVYISEWDSTSGATATVYKDNVKFNAPIHNK